MQLAHQLTIHDYWQFLRRNAAEAQALFNDLLISVTTFFRDPEAWAALQEQVIAPLVDADARPRSRSASGFPGARPARKRTRWRSSSTKSSSAAGMRPNLIIFASDVDEAALAVAREGVYPRAISADVSESRLERYFRPEDDHYRVVAELRDSHRLRRAQPAARSAVLAAPPDLVPQSAHLPRSRPAGAGHERLPLRLLATTAYLFLGASESAAEDLFQPVDKKHRIYRDPRRADGIRPLLPDILAAPIDRAVRSARDARTPSEDVTPPRSTWRRSSRWRRRPLVVDERWNVLHLSPSASRFFQQSGGPLARRVTDLVRPELRDELHVLLHRAIERRGRSSRRSSRCASTAASHRVAVLAQQRPQAEHGRRDVLVTFLDLGEATREAPAGDQEPER